MLKVALKIGKIGKIVLNKFVLKLLKTTVFSKNYISKKLILTQYLLLYPICNIQFNSRRTRFRVTGIKVIITKRGY